MRRLTATLCLTLAVLLGSAGVSVSQDLVKGLDAVHRGDYATALREFTPLAEQGDDAAQFFLGMIYDYGDGVPQNFGTAVKWYTLAAEQGYSAAQISLGARYYNGEGVLQDYVYAHMWWNFAASNGNENGGKLRDIVAEWMTPANISAAQDLARECVRKNYKGC